MATTTIRAQPMKASNGMIAEENMRLQAERDRLEGELAELSKGPEADAARVIRQADALIEAHEAEVAKARAARDALDERFNITAREEAAARAKARREYRTGLCRGLMEREASRLANVATAERKLKECVAHLNAAYSDHAELRRISNELGNGLRLSFSVSELSPEEFTRRIGAGIMLTLKGVQVPGSLAAIANRIGSLELHSSPDSKKDQPWAEREERALAPAIQGLIEHGENA